MLTTTAFNPPPVPGVPLSQEATSGSMALAPCARPDSATHTPIVTDTRGGGGISVSTPGTATPWQLTPAVLAVVQTTSEDLFPGGADDDLRTGLAALDRELAKVLRRIPAANADLRQDCAQEAAAEFVKARKAGKSPAKAIRAGLRAADRARRPKGSRSAARPVSLSARGVATQADAATAAPPREWLAHDVLAVMPADVRKTAHLVWLIGYSQAAAGARLKRTRHQIREALDCARAMAAEELVRRGVLSRFDKKVRAATSMARGRR